MTQYKDTEQQALEQIPQGPGRIEMSDEVIQTITAVETTRIPGLTLSDTRSKIIEIISGKKDLSKYVQVKVEENHVTIGISIVVDYGQSIYEISRDLQRRIKNAVEGMTGKLVKQVNVMVKGINMDSINDTSPETKVTAELLIEEDKSEKE